MRMPPGLVGKKKHAARAQILVMTVQAYVIKRNEIVLHADLAALQCQIEQGVAPFRNRSLRWVEAAVTGRKKNVSTGIGGRRRAAHPDAAVKAVGRRDEHILLDQRGRIVSKQPAM